ncbi:hypothetical protein [Jiangella rhizosphaerae]|uniref:Ribosomal protein L7/L12 C-terminal domain-containing protein n=1 Tax=Jiangella rhizosphaerae TaxID=2293569 RepID=A0A418KVV0_9ACTN|nr:hypothetical protein [Jiangella rhizosphaerae]RIQ34780.1 hypothetical protein DY240_03395 [Jiangella rhizosphaerae]
MDFWLIVVIAFGAALVIGFGIVLVRARADAVSGPTPSSPGAERPVLDRAELDAAVGALLAEGRLIPAVKLIRQQTGLGLAEAKAYADRLAAGADSAPPPQSPRASISPEAMARIQHLVAQGKKLQAVKELREHTRLGLREAKLTVDRMAESAVVLAAEPPEPPADRTDEVMARVQALVAEGKKIQAIKLLLDNAPDLDLRKAKEIVDRL